MPEFSRVAQPLYQLLQKGAEYVWSSECQQAYDELKQSLCKPGLALRQPVDGLPFHLYVDWSTTGIAAVLNQREDDGNEYMVACASRSLNPAERNYPAWKGEALAAVWGVKLFRPYLLAVEFFLHTDHRALLWLLTHKEPVGQQMRWILALQEYRFSLVHKPGAANPADVPSREPNACMADVTGARLDTGSLDWPLPTVLHSDLSVDNTSYSHDLLSKDLGITPKSTKRAKSTDTSALATTDESHTCLAAAAVDSLLTGSAVAAALAAEPQPHPSKAQLQHDVLEFVMASNDSAVDQIAPLPVSLLGGGY